MSEEEKKKQQPVSKPVKKPSKREDFSKVRDSKSWIGESKEQRDILRKGSEIPPPPTTKNKNDSDSE